jgi:hypothetical protein
LGRLAEFLLRDGANLAAVLKAWPAAVEFLGKHLK